MANKTQVWMLERNLLFSGKSGITNIMILHKNQKSKVCQISKTRYCSTTYSFIAVTKCYCHWAILLKWHEAVEAFWFCFLSKAQWHLVKQSSFPDMNCLFSSLAHFLTDFLKNQFKGVNYILWMWALVSDFPHFFI